MSDRLHAAEDPVVSELPEARLTVEQLANETGMSVRNIRNHQSSGLLPSPEVRARVGYYSDAHVTRLRLIQEMQAQGFKLSAIKRLIGEHGASIEEFLGLRHAISAPFETEPPQVLSAVEIAERFPDAGEKELAKAQRLGLLLHVGDGLFEAPSPALIRAAEQVVAIGVPLTSALTAIGTVKRSAETASNVFVRLFLDDVWKPFIDAGQPRDRWPEIIDAIERLRPVASEAMLAMFKQTMHVAVDDAFGKALEHEAKRRR